MTGTPLTVFACPPHCPAGAGGPQSDGGHLFGRDWTSEDERTYSKQCRCGLLAIDWSLFGQRAACSPHRLARSKRVPSIVFCVDCGEGTAYLFGHPGGADARALGCVCPPDQPTPDWAAGEQYTVDPRCTLHTPDDERPVSQQAGQTAEDRR